MVDYKKYIQVLEILKKWSELPDNMESMASAICELFDTDKINNFLWNNLKNGGIN